MVNWETVREIALSLPEVEEGTAYRKPAFRVAGKGFTAPKKLAASFEPPTS